MTNILSLAVSLIFAIYAPSANAQPWKRYASIHLKDTIPLIGDVNGDARDDLIIYKKDSGRWYAVDIQRVQDAVKANNGKMVKAIPRNAIILDGLTWGMNQGDIPLIGDTDGDYIDELIIYRPRVGAFFSWEGKKNVWNQRQRTEDGVQFRKIGKGTLQSVPLVADINGDGKDDLVTWDAGQVGWSAWDRFGKQVMSNVPWGSAGDLPLSADVLGNRRAELIIWRASLEKYYIASPRLIGDQAEVTFGSISFKSGKKRTTLIDGAPFGDDNDLPLIFGKKIGRWRPRDGDWRFARPFTASGERGRMLADISATVRWGRDGDIPLVGQLNGFGEPEYINFRPSTGTFDIYIAGRDSNLVGVPPLDSSRELVGALELADNLRMGGSWIGAQYSFDLADQPDNATTWLFWGNARDKTKTYGVFGRTNGKLSRGVLIPRDPQSQKYVPTSPELRVFETELDKTGQILSGEIRVTSNPFDRSPLSVANSLGRYFSVSRNDTLITQYLTNNRSSYQKAFYGINEPLRQWINNLERRSISQNFAFDWVMPNRYGFDVNRNGILDLPNSEQYVMNTGHVPARVRNPFAEKSSKALFRVDLFADEKVIDPYYLKNPEELEWTVKSPNLKTRLKHRGLKLTAFLEEGVHRVSLGPVNGRDAGLTRFIEVSDHLVALMGDSFASGEGAPERQYPNFPLANRKNRPALPVGVWADPGFNPPLKRHGKAADPNRNQGPIDFFQPDWPKMLREYKSNSDYRRFIDNTISHRSSFTNGSRYALMLEEMDTKSSVTFVNVAQSGAQMKAGVFGPYRGLNNVPTGVYRCSENGSADEKDCDGWWLTPNNWQPSVMSGTSCQEEDNCKESNDDARPWRLRGLECPLLENAQGMMCPQILLLDEMLGTRDIDQTYISIGGNDVGFGNILALLTVAFNGDIQGTYEIDPADKSATINDRTSFFLPSGLFGKENTIAELWKAVRSGRWDLIDYSNFIGYGTGYFRTQALSKTDRETPLVGLDNLIDEYKELDFRLESLFSHRMNDITLIPPPFFGGTLDRGDLDNYNDINGDFAVWDRRDKYWYCEVDIDIPGSINNAFTGLTSLELAWTRYDVYEPLIEKMNMFVRLHSEASDREGKLKNYWRIVNYDDMAVNSHGICAKRLDRLKAPGPIAALDYGSGGAWFNAPSAVYFLQTGNARSHKGIFHPNHYGFAYVADRMMEEAREFAKETRSKNARTLKNVFNIDEDDQILEARPFKEQNDRGVYFNLKTSDDVSMFKIVRERGDFEISTSRNRTKTYPCPTFSLFDKHGRLLKTTSENLSKELRVPRDTSSDRRANKCSIRLASTDFSTTNSDDTIFLGVSAAINERYDPVSGRADEGWGIEFSRYGYLKTTRLDQKRRYLRGGKRRKLSPN
ncbi:MAG: VCBS repeat-containing protein [Pseudomonadota bacterium]